VTEPVDGLRAAWAALVPAAGAAAVGERLLAAYGEPHRGYHDQQHLAEVLAAVDRLAAGVEQPVDRRAVRLAAWFHDAVYDPTAAPGETEESSARLAEQLLPPLRVAGPVVARVAALVRATATHDGVTGMDADLLFDADLAILASPPERYAAYRAGVRAEYAHVPDADFRRGRAAILQGLLDRPRIYRTAAAYDAWEAGARAQVSAELATLHP
jgi:predicted metal-dependent HD superfamily phosphohydrolase